MLLFKRLTPIIFGLLFISAAVAQWPQRALAQGGGSFFSQGQAVYDSQNLAKSQQEALRDFLAQGVTQALGTLLNPSQMGSHYANLEAKLLKNPERYVQTYQIFSESPSGGLYRVTGQVTVSMNVLKRDVREMGLQVSESSSAPAAPPKAPEQTAEPAQNQSPAPSARTEPAERPSEHTSVPEQVPQVQQDVLWAVAEKWNGDWLLAGSGNDPRTPFAVSVLQESQDYLWSMNFPSAGSIPIDGSGNVPLEKLIALAQSSAIPNGVIGDATLREDGAQGRKFRISLKVVDMASGKPRGEIQREIPMGGSSPQEVAMRMAYEVVPQLDQLLRRPSAAVPPKTVVAAGDEWTLVIKSEYPYASWDALQQVLKDRSASLYVNRLELGQDSAKVKIQGIDSGFLDQLRSGVQLRDGSRMEATQYSPENRSVELTTVRF
jgi:hypothetical protein